MSRRRRRRGRRETIQFFSPPWKKTRRRRRRARTSKALGSSLGSASNDQIPDIFSVFFSLLKLKLLLLASAAAAAPQLLLLLRVANFRSCGQTEKLARQIWNWAFNWPGKKANWPEGRWEIWRPCYATPRDIFLHLSCRVTPWIVWQNWKRTDGVQQGFKDSENFKVPIIPTVF